MIGYAYVDVDRDRAMSNEALRLREALSAYSDAAPAASLNEPLWTLARVKQEASEPDWDGYGAAPVSDQTYERARVFLACLPVNVPTPDIAADPDGEISFEWSRSPNL